VAGTVVELGPVSPTVVLTAVVLAAAELTGAVVEDDVDVAEPASEPPQAKVVADSTPARRTARAKLTARRYRSDVDETGQG
jgi:hypothetical protein